MQNLKLLIYLSSVFWPGRILPGLNLSFHKCRARTQMQHSEIWSDKKSPPPVNLSLCAIGFWQKQPPARLYSVVGQFSAGVSCENQPCVTRPIIIHLLRKARNLPALFTFRSESTPDYTPHSSSTTTQGPETTSVSIVTTSSSTMVSNYTLPRTWPLLLFKLRFLGERRVKSLIMQWNYGGVTRLQVTSYRLHD